MDRRPERRVGAPGRPVRLPDLVLRFSEASGKTVNNPGQLGPRRPSVFAVLAIVGRWWLSWRWWEASALGRREVDQAVDQELEEARRDRREFGKRFGGRLWPPP